MGLKDKIKKNNMKKDKKDVKDLADVVKEKIESEKKKPEDIQLKAESMICICPICGADVDSNAPSCPHCGAIFEENKYECPFCSAVIEKKTRTCPNCNAVLVSEAPILERGESYLIKEERPTKGYEMFVGSVRMGIPATCITTTYPEKIQRRYKLEHVPIYWLTSSSGGTDALSPARPDFELTHTIYEFLNLHEGGVILLHGLEQILLESGYEKTLAFLKSVTDMISRKYGTLLVPLNPNVIKASELATIETLFDKIIEGEYVERTTPVIESMSVNVPTEEITGKKEIPEKGGISPDSETHRPGVSDEYGQVGVSADEKKKILRTERLLFPFTAIIGQDMMKRALLLNAINPMIGGVLIQGHRGTAKSVCVRGLTELLPEIEVVDGCRFSCNPNEPKLLCWECKERIKKGPLPIKRRRVRVIDLPLNATEDRVVGSLDIEKVMKEGLKAFEEGLLAEANRGILYIDEINLLDDYVVDILLDAAAMGVCTVERETISVSYPANFILVGSMNPEEGKLRPQLLDRLALMVEVKGIENAEDRVKIIELREEFTRDPRAFRRKYRSSQKAMRERIIKAQELLNKVEITQDILDVIANLSLSFKVDGHRADIMMQRTAQTNAAFEGRTKITKEDIYISASMILPHRMRKGPLEEEEFNPQHLKDLIDNLM